MNKEIELSVHQLVDFLLRKGDIDNRVFNRSSMTEGSLIHTSYQSKQGDDYISEYYLKQEFMVEGVKFILQGRADGIIVRGDEYTIDEIKSTVIDLKQFHDENLEWHLGQAKCYAYMFAKEKGLKSIGIKLTYIRQGNTKEKFYDFYTYVFEDLEKDIYDLLEQYLAFYNILFRKLEERNESIKSLNFPFDNYRQGQKDLAKYCYATATKGGRLFVEAPTGIGKTMSTLYPFIKAIVDDEKAKIFYLTAKNVGKLNARHAIQILKSKGFKATDILITAKDKICFCKDKACNPDECPFAIGYYNKIKDVIKESILQFDTFDYETICAIAKVHSVCPFELELDLSLFSDIIVCDYNYLFDSISYLKRFFDEDSSHYLALVDEAHNLVSRSREMYSASFDRVKFLAAKKSLKKSKNAKLKNYLSRFGKIFDSTIGLEIGEHQNIIFSEEHLRMVQRFIDRYQEFSKNNNEDITKELTELYLDVNRFQKMIELFDDSFLYYLDVKEDNIIFKIICMDASKFLNEISDRLKASVFFSATLSPIDYYKNLLGGKEKDPHLILQSPFPTENLKLLIAPKVSTKYRNREVTYQEVGEYISTFIAQKVGNYFVYLPSYEYLEKIQEFIHLDENVELHVQNRDMSELDREAFLDNFISEPKNTHVALAVLGGTFGEGIDLVSDRLIGLVIVGMGLSKINFESNKIAEYYDNHELKGFNYAYIFPGMNKVMQAVGRLIRSETDRGVALLIDERYMTYEYRKLFKTEWNDYETVISPEDMKNTILNFLQK